MKFVSWNVNGLRACMNKGFLDSFYELDADFFCLQETKLQQGQIQLELPGYEQYWCYAEKKGYSGTAIFTKHTPLSVAYGLGVPELDTEGRLITLEYAEFYLVTCYTPNAQRGLARIEHRLKWEEAFRSYLTKLDQDKPVILCGDLNVAHKEIDLKNPGSNRGNAGFSDEERNAFTALLNCGFTDSFRHLYPDKTGAYSWWSYMFNARANNAGWRIDYFVVSDRLAGSIYDATIHPDVLGSDHCPVGLDLNITCNGGIWSPEALRPAEKDNKETGRDFPAGPLFKLCIATILVLAILLPCFFMHRPEPIPPAETHAIEQPPLISQVIDRTGTVSLAFKSPSIYSSYLEEVITDGTTDWPVANQTVIYPIPDGQGHAVIGFPLKYNFFVQVIFTASCPYSSTDKPEISVDVTCPGNAAVMLAYYTDENDAVDGCFLYGFAPAIVDLQITASCNGAQQTLSVKEIVPTGIFDDLSTSQLLDLIQQSGKIQYTFLSAVPISLGDIVNSDPYIQQLLKRDDAIALLLDRFEQNNGHHSLSSATRLLTTQQFRARMTDAEVERMDQIIAKRNDELLYGIPIPQ